MATAVRPGTGRASGLRLGTVFGAPVTLAWSWFLAAVLITAIFTPWVSAYRPDLGFISAAIAFVYAVLLFASVLLHEFAHAVAARAFGYHIVSIELNVWGGNTSFNEAPAQDSRRARNSIVISLVGPVTNLALGAIGWALLDAVTPGSLPFLLLFAITFANIALGVVNLLPGLPLDGGRALESVVWRIGGDKYRGTIIASWAGRGIAVLVVAYTLVWPLLQGSTPSIFTVLWGGLIAFFMWNSASSEAKAAKIKRRVASFDLQHVSQPAIAVNQHATLLQATTAAQQSGGGLARIIVFDESGRPSGIVEPQTVNSIPIESWDSTNISQCTQLLGPWIAAAAGQDTRTVLEALSQQPHTEYVLLVKNDAITGLVETKLLFQDLMDP
ncbi:site-2 protease family protein [Saxibacter everestensis]|uniref:Zinc metalloprotease n=1 Tax=Saxibacter everestensis TaxID=2909229 RepID=A0ABY8QX77_9MICO|nr:site-2 protease family protein [Brevibacteriaceae bacterium ZFBP1038]